MWPESSSVKAVNLVKKSVTITEIMEFFLRDCFLLAHPVYINVSQKTGPLFFTVTLSNVGRF